MNGGIPRDFVWRRLHSLTGLWLSIYIIFHLWTNAKAGMGDGRSYVDEVNAIHEMTFLPFFELAILGIPILIHMVWGIHYLFTSKENSFASDGRKPYLEYGRNKAYTWQRITAWVLVLGLLGHIVHMRFLNYPEEVAKGKYKQEIVLGNEIEGLQKSLGFESISTKSGTAQVTGSFGAVTLLMVRDTFKSPLLVALYTLFVLSACFHGFNGLWTFMIKWGVTLTERSQRLWLRACQAIMVIVAGLGLLAIFGSVA